MGAGRAGRRLFPYFFVGTFIEAHAAHRLQDPPFYGFPYFFVGTFIEAQPTAA